MSTDIATLDERIYKTRDRHPTDARAMLRQIEQDEGRDALRALIARVAGADRAAQGQNQSAALRFSIASATSCRKTITALILSSSWVVGTKLASGLVCKRASVANA